LSLQEWLTFSNFLWIISINKKPLCHWCIARKVKNLLKLMARGKIFYDFQVMTPNQTNQEVNYIWIVALFTKGINNAFNNFLSQSLQEMYSMIFTSRRLLTDLQL